jgi:MerR family copper efflux transcriptional regulator
MKAMTISKAARAAGVGVEAVRFYERRHLIVRPPKPSSGGFRCYPPETIERIHFVRQAQGLGFSLREIEELLSLRADPATDCGQVRERAVAKLEDVARKIGELERFRRALEELIAACPGSGALRACSIIEALAGVAGGRPPPKARAGAAMAARHRAAARARGKRGEALRGRPDTRL